MPLAVSCLLDRSEIPVAEAQRLRDEALNRGDVRPDFRCISCGEPVTPHKEGTYGAAHFEHLDGNPACPLADPRGARS